MLPSLPGVMVFSASFGALAAQKGQPFFQAMSMNAFAHGGLSQFLALEMWSQDMTVALALAILGTTFVVNLRLIFSSAALQPWLSGASPWQIYPSLFFLTMSNWILTTRYKNEGGNDIGYLFGSGFLAWLIWVFAAGLGYLSGRLVSNPERYAVDLILPLFLVVLLAPTYKRARKAVPWIVAGATALILRALIPGHYYIVLGVIAGALAGALLADE